LYFGFAGAAAIGNAWVVARIVDKVAYRLCLDAAQKGLTLAETGAEFKVMTTRNLPRRFRL